MQYARLSMLAVAFFLCAVSANAALSQADLSGHWLGTLTDSTGQTVYKLDFILDPVGVPTGSGDGRPLVNSNFVLDSAGNVSGSIHWFYVDNGVFFTLPATGVTVSAAPNAPQTPPLQIAGTVDGSSYVAPRPLVATGKWTLSLAGGERPQVDQAGTIEFAAKPGGFSRFDAKLIAPDAVRQIPETHNGKASLKLLTSLTLTIGSASFPLLPAPSGGYSDRVALRHSLIEITARGLNLIELLGLNTSVATQTVTSPISIIGTDPSGKSITFLNRVVTFQVVLKRGALRGHRVPGN